MSHASGRYSCAPSSHARVQVHNATVTATWQFATLSSVPQYWRATPTEAVPCFGKLVPSRINTPVRSGTLRAQARPHGRGVLRRMRNEVLEGLIPGVAQSRPHCLHRFPATVAEQPRDIPTQRAALTSAPEAILERLQPCQQPTQPRTVISRPHARPQVPSLTLLTCARDTRTI